mgnify:CR=1 FL=1
MNGMMICGSRNKGGDDMKRHLKPSIKKALQIILVVQVVLACGDYDVNKIEPIYLLFMALNIALMLFNMNVLERYTR